MRFKWFKDWFVEPPAPGDRPLRDLSKFELGVCPGCRGLRAQASPRCSHCGSAAPVTADA